MQTGNREEHFPVRQNRSRKTLGKDPINVYLAPPGGGVRTLLVAVNQTPVCRSV